MQRWSELPSKEPTFIVFVGKVTCNPRLGKAANRRVSLGGIDLAMGTGCRDTAALTNRVLGCDLSGIAIYEIKGSDLVLPYKIQTIRAHQWALLYSNPNHLVSQDSTVSDPYFAFHSFSVH